MYGFAVINRLKNQSADLLLELQLDGGPKYIESAHPWEPDVESQSAQQAGWRDWHY